ncbi:RidA family protein [Nisaea sp.]|uniref:RidA family protein n=1 Tax=Nisaea sp. TaxID=2024842 RepID=UPI003262FA1B
MQRKLVSSGSYLEPIIGFSRAVRVGDFISVAGTAPIGIDGKTDGVGDVYRQTVRCLEIVKAAIEDAGGSIEDVIRTRILVTDAKTWEEAARAHGEVFADIRPACTVMEVPGFVDPDWLVEIEAEAICQAED